MSSSLIRLLVILVIGAMVFFGLRKIWRDWTGQFRKLDEEQRDRVRARDQQERAKPGIIDLKRDADGTYRPQTDEEKRRRD